MRRKASAVAALAVLTAGVSACSLGPGRSRSAR